MNSMSFLYVSSPINTFFVILLSFMSNSRFHSDSIAICHLITGLVQPVSPLIAATDANR